VDADKSAFEYNNGMSSDPLELSDEARAEYDAGLEAIEIAKARGLAAMTDEQARQIIQSLKAVERRPRLSDWSGLVEQQAIFHKKRRVSS